MSIQLYHDDENSLLLSWKKERDDAYFQFSNVSFTVTKSDGLCRKTSKQILHNLSGEFKTGELACILGPSGSGKSTFLDFLACRLDSNGVKTGTLLFNGHPVDKNYFRHVGGYVPQDDILLSTATVRETLMYAAMLSLGGIPYKRKKKRVDTVLNLLGLTECQDVYIGNEWIRGVSGGQRKRVAVGQEILKNPRVLLLDEPTSGLDSSTAYSLIRTLRQIAKTTNTCIITTIHQPSYELLRLFDRAMVLAKGHMIYFGLTVNIPSYFSSVGFPIPSNNNPADYILDLVSNRYLGQTDANVSEESLDQALAERIETLAIKYQEKNEKTQLTKVHPSPEREQFIQAPIWQQILVLSLRFLRVMWREPMLFWAECIQYILFALFTGALYYQLQNDHQGVVDRLAGFFFIIAGLSFIPAMSVVATFPEQRQLFQREKKSNLYGTLAYYVAYTITHLPLELLFPLVFTCITYWMIGLRSSALGFFGIALIVILVQIIAESVGLLVGSLVQSVDIANIIVTLAFTIWMSVGGFLVKNERLHWIFYPLAYTSLYRYSFIAMTQIEFPGREFSCAGQCSLPDRSIVYNGTTIPLKKVEQQICSLMECHYKYGNTVVTETNVDNIPFWGNVLILMGMIVIFRVIIYFALRFKKWNKN